MADASKQSTDVLRDAILKTIAEAGLRPGDRIPTERELARVTGRSRNTVREALRSLERDGMLTAIQGSGRFLTATSILQVERPITRYESVTEMMESLGYEVTSVVIDVVVGLATPVESEALDREVGAPVIRLTRIRFGDEEPMIFSVNVVPRDVLPGPVEHRDWSGSVSQMLGHHGCALMSSIARIGAATLPEPYAERHDLHYDPWLLIEETGLTAEGRRVLYSLDYHRGDRVAFNVLRHR